MSFDSFFRTATGNTPYDYQRSLAGGDACRHDLDISRYIRDGDARASRL